MEDGISMKSNKHGAHTWLRDGVWLCGPKVPVGTLNIQIRARSNKHENDARLDIRQEADSGFRKIEAEVVGLFDSLAVLVEIALSKPQRSQQRNSQQPICIPRRR